VLGAGRIVFEGTQRDFIQAEEVRREWLGVG
jgi:ABC-type lipopolysaccharide export system ATPase subunit